MTSRRSPRVRQRKPGAQSSKLITGADSIDTAQLEAATSVLCSAIADEYSASVPIVVKAAHRDL